MTDNMRMDPDPAANLDGYALVKKAIALRGQDPEMEFAAALITMEGPQDAHAQHAARAIAGAKDDPLLAENLKACYMGVSGKTVAELFSTELKASR